MYRVLSNETALIAEVTALIKNESTIAPKQEKTPISLLNAEFCEELAFPYLLPNSQVHYFKAWVCYFYQICIFH